MKKIEWEEVARRGRNHAVLSMDLAAEGFRAGLVGSLLGSEFNITSFRQFAGARWIDGRELMEWIAEMKSMLEKDPGFLLKMGERGEGWVNRTRAIVDSIAGREYADATNSELAGEFERFCAEYRNVVVSYFYVAINRFYPDLLTQMVAKREKDPRKQAELFAALLALGRKTGMKKERESLLNIAHLVEKGESIDHLVEEHSKKYAYLGHYVFYGEPYDEKKIRQRLEVLMEKGSR
ncbi:MAG: hypothetical protein V1835_05265 [Candidatus Micrarchaeota archaeon]